MNEGDVLICIDPKDEHYLQVGYVNLIDMEGFEATKGYNEKLLSCKGCDLYDV